MMTAVQESKTQSKKKDHRVQPFVWVLLIFFISCLIRAWLIPSYRHMNTYSDELRYVSIARSIFYEGTISIRNVPTYFQKILYSLLLGPALLFHNSVTQVRVMGYLNVLYSNSSVFPAYLIAKKYCRSEKSLLLAVLFTALLPDMVFSITFMSENVYMPIALWLLFVVLRIFEAPPGKAKLCWAFLGGMLNYLLYLNKEVALFFLLSYFLLLPIIWKEKKDKSELAAFAAYCLGFFLLFFLFKLTLFNGLPNSYNQMSLEAIATPYRFVYFLYCIAYNGLFAVVAFCFFPLFAPLLNRDQMKPEQKIFFYYLFLCLITVVVTISYTISVREDLGYPDMRQHTRYYAVLFIPFFICFLNWAENRSVPDRMDWLAFMALTLILACFIFTVLSTIRVGAGHDTMLLRWWDFFCRRVNELIPMPAEGGGLRFNLMSLMVKSFFVCFMTLGAFGIFRHKKTTISCIIGVIFVLFLFDNCYGSVSCIRAYRAGESEAVGLSAVNDFLQDTGGNCLYLMSNTGDSPEDKLVDTYITCPRLYAAVESSVTGEALNKIRNQEPVENLKTITWTSEESDLSFSLDSADMILCRADAESQTDLSGLNCIDLPGAASFKLYLNPDALQPETGGIWEHSY